MQSLRTRSELKNELRLAQTTVQDTGKNPLKFAVDASEALGILLQGENVFAGDVRFAPGADERLVVFEQRVIGRTGVSTVALFRSMA